MTTIQCKSYGVPLQVELADEALLPCLAELLPFGAQISSEPDPHASAFSLSSARTADQFARDVMIHVANFAPDRVFLHAGVVGWRGRALLLPGPSFAGKTTLTAALVRAGATYYSDEYAVLDQEGLVHPYARSLQMRAPGANEQTSLPVSALNGHAGTIPLRAAQVVFARYEPGAAWDPQPLSHGMAVLEMLRHSIPVQRTPARVMSTLSRMLEATTAWESKRDDATLTAQLLLTSLEEQLTPNERLQPEPEPIGAARR